MIDKATESEEGKKAIKFIRDTLDSKFIDGKFIEDGELFTVEKDQLSDFDMETVTQVFKSLTGQDQGPKVDSV